MSLFGCSLAGINIIVHRHNRQIVMEGAGFAGTESPELMIFDPVGILRPQKRAAKRTDGQLNGRRSHFRFPSGNQLIQNGFRAFHALLIAFHMVGRHFASHPQADGDFTAGQVFLPPDIFTFANQRCGPFKLLSGEHPQGIAHQHGHAAALFALGEPPVKNGESGNA